jgi:hypothetical protein
MLLLTIHATVSDLLVPGVLFYRVARGLPMPFRWEILARVTESLPVSAISTVSY